MSHSRSSTPLKKSKMPRKLTHLNSPSTQMYELIGHLQANVQGGQNLHLFNQQIAPAGDPAHPRTGNVRRCRRDTTSTGEQGSERKLCARQGYAGVVEAGDEKGHCAQADQLHGCCVRVRFHPRFPARERDGCLDASQTEYDCQREMYTQCHTASNGSGEALS